MSIPEVDLAALRPLLPSAVFTMLLLVALHYVWKLLRIPFAAADSLTAAAKMPKDAYKGKVVWVTGASSGIGKELVIQLAAQGAKLILSARREDTLKQIQSQLGRPDGDVVLLPLDLSDVNSLPKKAVEARQFFGRIDVLVNNGGMAGGELVRNTSHKVVQRIMDVNFMSAATLAENVLPGMVEQKVGQIINVSSIAAKLPVPYMSTYVASKYAMLGFFGALGAEERALNSNIHVSVALPGVVKTEIQAAAVSGSGEKTGLNSP